MPGASTYLDFSKSVFLDLFKVHQTTLAFINHHFHWHLMPVCLSGFFALFTQNVCPRRFDAPDAGKNTPRFAPIRRHFGSQLAASIARRSPKKKVSIRDQNRAERPTRFSQSPPASSV
jgi:hypothetical protein